MSWVSRASWEAKKEVRTYYNEISTSYDILYHQEQAKKYHIAVQMLDVSNDDIILDVGCGTGLFLEHIAYQQYTVFIGVDISKKILKQAVSYFKLVKNIHFLCCDADYLPLCEGVFNKIFSFTLLQNMPHPQITLSEIDRVAKQDAVIVLTGQKKCFTKQKFVNILQKAKLTILHLFEDGLQDYVVICKKQICVIE